MIAKSIGTIPKKSRMPANLLRCCPVHKRLADFRAPAALTTAPFDASAGCRRQQDFHDCDPARRPTQWSAQSAGLLDRHSRPQAWRISVDPFRRVIGRDMRLAGLDDALVACVVGIKASRRGRPAVPSVGNQPFEPGRQVRPSAATWVITHTGRHAFQHLLLETGASNGDGRTRSNTLKRGTKPSYDVLRRRWISVGIRPPTSNNSMPGTCDRTSGMMLVAAHIAASTLGGGRSRIKRSPALVRGFTSRLSPISRSGRSRMRAPRHPVRSAAAWLPLMHDDAIDERHRAEARAGVAGRSFPEPRVASVPLAAAPAGSAGRRRCRGCAFGNATYARISRFE